MSGFKIEKGFYPIVYVRGFTPSSGSREEAFYDAYYGYSETSVEKRNAPPPNYAEPIVFEGQLIRLLKEYGYVDAANGGLALALSNGGGFSQNPTRSLWISRFYDQDVLSGSVRDIVDHARDLKSLICEKIPRDMEEAGADLGVGRKDYKVIIIAHSMGGLVSRCLIQNLLATESGGEAERWIHRFVTMGTPHGGIELGAVPDFLEDLLAGEANLLNGAIFKEKRMRDYLKLTPKPGEEPLSLQSLNWKFPEGKCLCIIGSDYNSYGAVKRVTGNHSDGLVKQDRAYIKGAYWANVHRAHSGRRGIVNSFESYENVRRFLFGDTRVRMWLENVALGIKAPEEGVTEFFDIEFSLSIRGTGVYLHQRKQNPCENAFRLERKKFPLKDLHIHTGFLDTSLRPKEDPYSQFLLTFKISQHQVKKGFLFETQFPERTIYSESMDVRVDLSGQSKSMVDYRWLSETKDMSDKDNWLKAELVENIFRFPFRKSKTLTGTLCIEASKWNEQAASVSGENVSKE
jgi:pimeloyl-ACP methyl ester carboxylesterase